MDSWLDLLYAKAFRSGSIFVQRCARDCTLPADLACGPFSRPVPRARSLVAVHLLDLDYHHRLRSAQRGEGRGASDGDAGSSVDVRQWAAEAYLFESDAAAADAAEAAGEVGGDELHVRSVRDRGTHVAYAAATLVLPAELTIRARCAADAGCGATCARMRDAARQAVTLCTACGTAWLCGAKGFAPSLYVSLGASALFVTAPFLLACSVAPCVGVVVPLPFRVLIIVRGPMQTGSTRTVA